MTDLLSQRLQDGTKNLPVSLREPAAVRRAAVRGQAGRRALAGTLTAAVALAVAVGVVLLSGGGSAPAPPAETPTTSTQSPPAEPARVTEIPAGTRFHEERTDRLWRVEGVENRLDRRSGRTVAWELDPCAATVYPTDAARSAMLTVSRRGPEYRDTLQLGLYPDAATAAEVIAGFGRAVAECRDEVTGGTTHRIWTMEPLRVGDEGLLAVARYEVEGLQVTGSMHVAVFREDSAVFMRSSSGEGFPVAGQPDAIAREVKASARRNQTVVCELVSCR